MSSPNESRKKPFRVITRRQAISTVGKAAIGVGAAVVVGGGVAAYYLSRPSSAVTTTTTSTSSTTLPTSTSSFSQSVSSSSIPSSTISSSAASSFSSSSSTSSSIVSTSETVPLDFTNWGYLPNVIQANIAEFQSENPGLKVNSDTIPECSIASVNEAKMASGGLVEVTEVNIDDANKWYDFGWIQNLDNDPVTPNVKKDVIGGTYLSATEAADGSIIGRPYAPQAWVLFENMKMLGGTPSSSSSSSSPSSSSTNSYSNYTPTSWDDLLSTCMDLQKSGVTQYPYNPQWGPSVYFGTPWAFYGQCHSEGEYLLDANTLEPSFDTSTPIMKVLENWQAFWNNKLVDPGVWTRGGLDMINAFSTGTYAFACGTDTFRSFYSNPQSSKIAGYAHISPKVPGSAGTVTDLAVIFALATPSKSNRSAQRQQEDLLLLDFMGYKNNAGQFYADKQYFLQGGVDPSYTALYSDSDVLAAVPQYYYNTDEFTALQGLYSASIIPRGWRAIWFPDWESAITTEIYNGVTGAESLTDCVNNLLKSAKTTAASYAGTTPSTSASTTSVSTLSASS